MKFHYEFDIKKLESSIHHQHKLFLIGSCFTENIGEKFKQHKFSVLENPNGILFNPVSVAEALINIIQNKQYTATDLFELNETWHSWQHHSRYSGITAQDAVNKINTSAKNAHEYLKQADYLFITLGSAWVYTLTDKASNAKTGTVAANNHKAPADWFEKRLMNPAQVEAVLGTMLDHLGVFNPNIKVIFTISPVRHLREGVINNNRSKAVLIQAVHGLIEKLSKLYYFPAYELIIDDLRDYRFYAEDLVHPNYAATEYVWNKLIDAYTNAETKDLMKHIAEINIAYKHKPFNPLTNQHKKFLKTYLEKTKQLQEKYSYINFAEEIKYFNSLF
ncbi:MAG: GSCFA domain-containing protein [Bacteroidetes bacterium]|nr:GSCFA domain-containing protein [Bacteroidota bacterium]MBS1650215.1 GSCFA domain-containing protein [Bacteroidota bacterium]